MSIAGFDLETTGTDPESARIVTATVGIYKPMEDEWWPRSWILKQDAPIPQEATAVHGITTEQANRLGVSPREALTEIWESFQQAAEITGKICIFNAVYDLTVLDRELQRYGIGEISLDGMTIIDPMVIDRATCSQRFIPVRDRKPSLESLRALAGVPASAEHKPGWFALSVAYARCFRRAMPGHAHGSDADARAAAELGHVLSAKLPWADTPEGKRENAMGWQMSEYAAQQRSFAQWLARQGDSDEERAEKQAEAYRIEELAFLWPFVPKVASVK